MKNEINIEKLATLSRISVSPEEQKSLAADIDSILSYIEQIQDVSDDKIMNNEPDKGLAERNHNVMREDEEPHTSGIYTKELLHEAPGVKDNYLEVKKIINQDN